MDRRDRSLIALVVLIAVALGYRQFFRKDNAIMVNCQTTKGLLEIAVEPDWSPNGAQRFLQMVDDGYYSHVPLFRCVERFVCQFGPKPPPFDAKKYAPIPDDRPLPHLRHFKPGYLSFAGYAPNSRNYHVFIALGAVDSLGTQAWETPFGYVTETSFNSAAVHFNTSYGESAAGGSGPDPQKIEAEGGVKYLKDGFPRLDEIVSCQRKK
jgi:peptidyl-prolyl cis-trans isomerase A (cyclophilin A)